MVEDPDFVSPPQQLGIRNSQPTLVLDNLWSFVVPEKKKVKLRLCKEWVVANSPSEPLCAVLLLLPLSLPHGVSLGVAELEVPPDVKDGDQGGSPVLNQGFQ